jgi:hypothetical protein
MYKLIHLQPIEEGIKIVFSYCIYSNSVIANSKMAIGLSAKRVNCGYISFNISENS